MTDLHDLWEMTSALKTSLPFAIALPLLVAIAFATLVDWLERYLLGHQSTQGNTEGDQALRLEHHTRQAPPREWPAFGGHARKQRSA
jgi:hypothetical protein